MEAEELKYFFFHMNQFIYFSIINNKKTKNKNKNKITRKKKKRILDKMEKRVKVLLIKKTIFPKILKEKKKKLKTKTKKN